VFSKSNEPSGSPATACHPGAQGPSTANALSRGHSPENHPESPPNSITNGEEAREDSRGQTFVAGRSFGEIAEGAEAQPTPPMNKADVWPPMGPPFGPRRNTVPMRKKVGNRNRRNSQERPSPKAEKNLGFEPPPPDPAGPARQGPSLRPPSPRLRQKSPDRMKSEDTFDGRSIRTAARDVKPQFPAPHGAAFRRLRERNGGSLGRNRRPVSPSPENRRDSSDRSDR
jgi:hypothetical protein